MKTDPTRTDTFGSSAFIAFVLALHELMPRSGIVDVEINGDICSIVVSFHKAVGPELADFLSEAMRAVSRKQLPVRSFSMVDRILLSYIKQEKRLIERRLQERLLDESLSGDVIDVVEVGSSFCLEEEPFFQSVSSTGDVKWIEIAHFELLNAAKTSARIIIVGAASAKELSKKKSSVRSFFGRGSSGISEIDFLKKEEEDGEIGLYPVYTPRALCRLRALMADFGMDHEVRLPMSLLEIDASRPLTAICDMWRMWREAAPILRSKQKQEWFGALSLFSAAAPPARLAPLPNLRQTTTISLFTHELPLSAFQEMAARLIDLSALKHPEALVSVRLLASPRMPGAVRKKIMGDISACSGGIEIQAQSKSGLDATQFALSFDVIWIDGQLRPSPRAMLLAEATEGNVYLNCCCIPFISYEEA